MRRELSRFAGSRLRLLPCGRTARALGTLFDGYGLGLRLPRILSSIQQNGPKRQSSVIVPAVLNMAGRAPGSSQSLGLHRQVQPPTAGSADPA